MAYYGVPDKIEAEKAFNAVEAERKLFYVETQDNITTTDFSSILQKIEQEAETRKQAEEEVKKAAAAALNAYDANYVRGNGPTGYKFEGQADNYSFNSWTAAPTWSIANTSTATVNTATTGYITTTCGTATTPAWTFSAPNTSGYYSIPATTGGYYSTYCDPNSYTTNITFGAGDLYITGGTKIELRQGTPAEERVEKYNGLMYKSDSELLNWTMRNKSTAGEFEFMVFTENGQMNSELIESVCPAKATIKLTDGSVVKKSFILLPTKKKEPGLLKPDIYGTVINDYTEHLYTYGFVVNTKKGEFEVRMMLDGKDLQKAMKSL